MTLPLWQKVKRTKNPLDERETGEWKTCLKTQHSKKIKIKKIKLNIQKTKIMACGPITSWQIDGETVETVTDCFGGLQNQCRW